MCKRVSSNGSYDYQLTGIGWTLIDSSYATNEYTPAVNDYFVMYSEGEDGSRRMYVKVKILLNTFEILGFLSWDATTHAGVRQYGIVSSGWNNTSATNNILWVYGDLDSFVGVTKYGTTYYAGAGGWMPGSSTDQTITVCPNSITAGSSVTVTFTSVPAEWVVGKYLFVSDDANIERVVVSGVSGNDVTFSAFVASYASSARFSLERTEYVIGGGNFSSQDFLIGHNGTKDQPATFDNMAISNPTSGDGLTGKFPHKNIYLSNTTMWVGPMKNILSTLSTFTSETTHTIGADGYRFFNLSSNNYCLLKEV